MKTAKTGTVRYGLDMGVLELTMVVDVSIGFSFCSSKDARSEWRADLKGRRSRVGDNKALVDVVG